jgi:hypothetical protein
VCDARKKIALVGDGLLTNRKCRECPGGDTLMDIDKKIPKCKECGMVAKDGEKFFHKTQECKKCYDRRWRREHKKDVNAVVRENRTVETQAITLPVTAPATPVQPAPTPAKENGHILLLDFKEYDGWYDTLMEIAVEEMRTPANLVMYWIREHLKRGVVG